MRHEEEGNVKEAFHRYFSNLFSSTATYREDINVVVKVIKPKLNEEMNAQLNSRYTKEEVEASLAQMASLKSPSLNGLGAVFCQKH